MILVVNFITLLTMFPGVPIPRTELFSKTTDEREKIDLRLDSVTATEFTGGFIDDEND